MDDSTNAAKKRSRGAAPSRKTALVTGASGGIGKAIAEEFARNHVDVVISARGQSQLEAIASEWSAKYGVAVTPIASDLSQIGGAAKLADTVEARGVAVDYLVNNAGIGFVGLFKDVKLDDELAMMRINTESVVVLTKRLLPGIITRRGKIMNVASTAAFQPGPYMSIYFATKAFVLSWGDALAYELRRDGVTVTTFCPGATQSGFHDKAGTNRSGLTHLMKMPTSEEIGRVGYDAMMRGTGVLIPGLANNLLAQSVRFSPRRVVTALAARLVGPAR